MVRYTRPPLPVGVGWKLLVYGGPLTIQVNRCFNGNIFNTDTVCYVSVKFNGSRSIVVVDVVESDASFTESNLNDRFRLNPAIGRIRRANSL